MTIEEKLRKLGELIQKKRKEEDFPLGKYIRENDKIFEKVADTEEIPKILKILEVYGNFYKVELDRGVVFLDKEELEWMEKKKKN